MFKLLWKTPLVKPQDFMTVLNHVYSSLNPL